MTKCVWDFLQRFCSRILLVLVSFSSLFLCKWRHYPSDWWTDTPLTHTEDEFSWNCRSLPNFWLKSVPNIFQIEGKNLYSSFVHSVVCLTTGPQPPLKPVLHTVRYSVGYFNFQCPLVSLRSASSCLPLFPLPLVTYILPFTPSPTICF